MSGTPLLPDPSLVRFEYLSVTDEGVTLVATTVQVPPRCPDCQRPAQRVHSRYYRTVADQPWKSLHVRLRLRSRRWFGARERRIFQQGSIRFKEAASFGWNTNSQRGCDTACSNAPSAWET